tara:strand:+ start:377 stop:550 length:174 start_codon:yes stop_codon:yes gene_type:complete
MTLLDFMYDKQGNITSLGQRVADEHMLNEVFEKVFGRLPLVGQELRLNLDEQDHNKT